MEIQKKQDFLKMDSPRTDFWMLFKVSSYERLLQMQNGLLYMNSLDYFSNLKDEESLALRVDEHEEVYGILRAGPNEKGFSTLALKLGNGEEIDLGEEAILTAKFPRPKNTMLFCMGALGDGQYGVIPGEKDNQIIFDEKFLEFGSHLLLITKPTEFSSRINAALSKESDAFGSKIFHDGYGIVNYMSLKGYSGPIGLYTKDTKYSWQMEFRIAFGVEDHRLNNRGAFEFNIGDLSDISQIIPVQALIDLPMTVKRRTYIEFSDEHEQISG
ncbi:hypothetical protein [Shewanella frigidimarina]|uniref:hypothetical protein n=1 Tax=Shewanella frigidimarina TaxID=56812 RepID=UPI001FE06F7E|nr:hypothetical protein [Shewanella frigidimarina]